MSQAEFGNPKPTYTTLCPAMVAGTIAHVVPLYSKGNTVIDRIERVTAGGVPGIPFVGSPLPITPVPGLPITATVTISSSSALDTSVYRLYYHNLTEA